ncbi:uncharacterized protein LOC124349187 [Daphnia pulicaria]|uniref:uncharacterized protein LOC124349187 n=1 Tax=Daphnia pulicaria TaxID=35523 RepID=UPI001EEABE04|nr:uncharacterized protein LOC124349187 [Daphnia pulicaria]
MLMLLEDYNLPAHQRSQLFNTLTGDCSFSLGLKFVLIAMYYLFSKPLGADFQHIPIEVKATDTHWSHPGRKDYPLTRQLSKRIFCGPAAADVGGYFPQFNFEFGQERFQALLEQLELFFLHKQEPFRRHHRRNLGTKSRCIFGVFHQHQRVERNGNGHSKRLIVIQRIFVHPIGCTSQDFLGEFDGSFVRSWRTVVDAIAFDVGIPFKVW